MKTISDVVSVLRKRARAIKKSQKDLAEEASTTPQTLSAIFGKNGDFRVSTFLALIDRLGLELQLVPIEDKGEAEPAEPAMIKTRIEAALDRAQTSGSSTT